MVCLGNICRSPLAEGILQHYADKLGLAWTVESAGTNSYHLGSPPHIFSQKVAKAHGIDISAQRARRFSTADFQNYDIIYALATDVLVEIKEISKQHFDEKKVLLLMDELRRGEQQSVTDPWYGEEDGYLPVFQVIDEACQVIIKKYSTSSK